MSVYGLQPLTPCRRSRTREPYPHSDKTARRILVYWLVLVLSGALEAVWATAPAASDGFRRRRPAALFVVGVYASTAGLAYAMSGLPAGRVGRHWRRGHRVARGGQAPRGARGRPRVAPVAARVVSPRPEGGGLMTTMRSGPRAWLLLVASAVLEAVWASALAASKSFTEPLPSVVVVVAAVLSMIGLGQAAAPSRSAPPTRPGRVSEPPSPSATPGRSVTRRPRGQGRAHRRHRRCGDRAQGRGVVAVTSASPGLTPSCSG